MGAVRWFIIKAFTCIGLIATIYSLGALVEKAMEAIIGGSDTE